MAARICISRLQRQSNLPTFEILMSLTMLDHQHGIHTVSSASSEGLIQAGPKRPRELGLQGNTILIVDL